MPIVAYGKIKPLRQAKGLNQDEIAAELGVSRPTYVLMEQGEKEPTISQLYTLARLLGTEPDELCSNLPGLRLDMTDEGKLKDLLTTCIALGSGGGSIAKTKLSILAYLADFVWYRLHGKPLTGATYRYGLRGPAPETLLKVLDELYEGQAISIEPSGATLVFGLVEDRPAKNLNLAELSLVQDICAKWQSESTEALVEFVKQQAPCKDARLHQPIAYETILKQPENALF